MDNIYIKTLPNGLRIVGERMENYRSVSIGCWVKAGSVYENVGARCGEGTESGVSHFIEHMLFKGTKTRGADRIAEEIDSLGGNLNAFTSKECTCFYAKVIGENLGAATELIADLICASKLDGGDIEREKGVVSEEISMNEDAPEDVAHDALCSLYYGSEALASPILGTHESVGAFDADMLRGYMARRYRPENIVLAAAGNFEPERFTEHVEKAFDFSGITGVSARAAAESAVREPEFSGRVALIDKDIEQAHIALAFPGFASETPQQYPLLILNNIVGGCMSSRLFQSIREKKGLAYSVYSSPTFFTSGGYFTLYAGTGEKQAEKVLELMLKEYAQVLKKGVSADELERSKLQIKTGFLLGRESTGAHASGLGRSVLFSREYASDDEILARIDRVSLDSINEILPKVCDFRNMRAVIVGKVEKHAEKFNKIIENASAVK